MPPSFSHFRGLAQTLNNHFHDDVLSRWYPAVLDEKRGGYFTNLTYDWHTTPDQDKMIVSQARHVWTTSHAGMFEPEQSVYTSYALHGFRFLSTHMWDERYGGFFQVRNRDGGYTECRGWGDEKRTHGNACAIAALAALYGLTHDRSILALAQEAYRWLEVHAYDSEFKGYHQFLTQQGEPFDETGQYHSVAADLREAGLKDFNSTLQLLEAYTELFRVWNDDLLRSRLVALLELVRDTIVTKEGYLQLFFNRDWTPVTYRAASEATRHLNFGLDHISFGDDCKAAFLLLEAAFVLNSDGDTSTLAISKHLIDHAIDHGWDATNGGMYDVASAGNGDAQGTLFGKTKTWWVQAETLNTLLIASRIFPEVPHYQDLFERQWHYIDKFMRDHRNGDWYERGTDTDPSVRRHPKSHMWRCTYHIGRALMNAVALTNDDEYWTPGIHKHRRGLQAMIDHWKAVKVAPMRAGFDAVGAST